MLFAEGRIECTESCRFLRVIPGFKPEPDQVAALDITLLKSRCKSHVFARSAYPVG
jgi:hypothetical protein